MDICIIYNLENFRTLKTLPVTHLQTDRSIGTTSPYNSMTAKLAGSKLLTLDLVLGVNF